MININERVLGHFFRYKRTNADIAEYVVSKTDRRRTPGLTRDEVAALANVSTDWYTRIEQGRAGVNASQEVLRDLCRALKLNTAEVNYVFHLVGQVPPTATEKEGNDSIVSLIQAQVPAPAFMMDKNLTILQTNRSYSRIYGDLLSEDLLCRNAVWRTFNDEFMRTALNDWPSYARHQVALFRQIYSRDADSKFLYQVFVSVKNDPTFREAWDKLAVADFHEQRLLVNTVEVGELYLIENTLQIPDTGQYVVFQNAGDNSTENKLRVISTYP